MTGTLIVNARTWDAQNKALRNYEDRIEQLQAELDRVKPVLDAAIKYVEAGNIDGFRGHEIKRAVREYKEE